MTSGAVEHLRPSLRRRAKEVSGRAAEEKASAGDHREIKRPEFLQGV